KGWTFSSVGESIAFFDRPGYWLRINFIRGAWSSTISPEAVRPGDRSPYAPEDLVPDFRGKGARARARAFAVELIRENREWLEQLGAPLTCVHARLYSGSGRGGGVYPVPFHPDWMEEFQ